MKPDRTTPVILPIFVVAALWLPALQASDLVPRQFNTPSLVAAGQAMTLSWQVENAGSTTATQPWYDRVYLSTDAQLDSSDRSLEQQIWTQSVPAKGTYTAEVQTGMPNVAPGQYYLVLQIDPYNNVQETAENNNVLVSKVVQVTVADLQPKTLTAPSIVDAGESIEIKWDATNNGDAEARAPWYERIYLSTDDKLDGSDRVLGQASWQQNVAAKATYSSGLQVGVPNLAPGNYFLILEVDAYNNVFESAENNNVLPAKALQIRVPDLQPKTLSAPSIADAGESIEIKWDATNNGDAEARAPWYSRIYLSTDDKLDGSDRVLGQASWQQNVAAKATYSSGLQVGVPNLAPGNYFLILEIDPYNNVFESAENNNVLPAKALQIRVPDLQPKTLSAPSIVDAGEVIEIKWDATNNGDAEARATWYDRIYLSTDDKLDGSDRVLDQASWLQNVVPKATYSSGLQVGVPNLAPGNYFLILAIDAYNNVFESGENNNVLPAKAIQIRVPDLVPNTFSAPDIADAGQVIEITWEAGNTGDAEARADWYDRIYFSTDGQLDGQDRVLDQIRWTQTIPAAGKYNSKLQVAVPNVAPGTYYLFLEVDAYNNVFESKENNNRLPPRELRVRVPDLKPWVISAPESGEPSDRIKVGFEISNIGDAEARASWYDRVYLSTDGNLDGADRLLEQVRRTVNLSAGSNYTSTMDCSLPSLALGRYYLLLEADAYNNVYESKETNNVLARAFTLGPKPLPVMVMAKGKTEAPQEMRFNAPAGTRRVEYRLNDKLICTKYGPDFSLSFSDPLVGAEAFIVKGTNAVIATAFGDDDTPLCSAESRWSAWHEGMPTETEILQPGRGLEFYTDGAVSRPIDLLVQVRAVRQMLRLPEEGGGRVDVSMPKVKFFLDGNLIHESTNATPDNELIHEYNYRSPGLGRGRHTFRAVSVPGDGWRQSSDSVSFLVTNGYPHIGVTREVTQFDTYLRVELAIRNTGSGLARLNRLEEVATGFQLYGVTSDWITDPAVLSYNAEDKQGKFAVEFPNPSNLPSNGVCTITYRAVPILFGTDTAYALGGGGLLEFEEQHGTVHTQSPLPATTSVQVPRRKAFTDAIPELFRNSDYLLVTSPSGLDTYFRAEGMNQVLPAMAELAALRNGVLGYYDTVGGVRTSFRAGDLIATGMMFRPDRGRDQIFIGRADDNSVRCYYETGEKDDHLMPMCLETTVSAYDLAAGDAMAAGALAEGPSWPQNRCELFFAPLNGPRVYMYVYVEESDQMSRDSWDVDHFYETGDALVLGNVVTEAADRTAKEVIVAKSTGEVRAYQFAHYGHAPDLTFTSAYRSGDLLAAGCLIGDWHDEIVVGDMDEDKIRVYVLNDAGTSFVERAWWRRTLDSGDAMAIGDVCGDSRDEIVVIDASADIVHVYGNTTGFTFEEVTSFSLVFDSNDRLAVGYVGGTDKASILRFHERGTLGHYAGTVDVIKLGGGEAPGDKWDLDEMLNAGGLWASQLDTNWTTSGFLLLVGEDGVVPTFTANFDLTWSSDLGGVDFTDRNYASTGSDASRPELAMGRIPGSSADALYQALRTAIDVALDEELLENRSAYCVSGLSRGPSGDSDDIDFVSSRNVIADVLSTKGFDTVFEQNCPSAATFFGNADDRDVIYLAGHGNYNVWDIIDSAMVDADFVAGAKRPLIYAYSCLTGRYPAGWSLPERFLQRGASSYVGATESQVCAGDERGWGPRYAQRFITELRENRALGTTWKETVLIRLDANSFLWDPEYNAYHCAIIHYFGDPKLEMTWSSPGPVRGEEPVFEPAPELALNVPMYTVTAVDGEDLVQIPGEQEQVLQPGRPLLPAYVANMKFPPGQKVQSVILKSRSEALPGPALKLPIIQLAIPGGDGGGSITNDPGWWPELPYTWQTTEAQDGSTTLRIIAYAVQATNRSEIRFFSNYVFGIEYTPSSLEIQRLATERPVYPTGAVVRAELSLRNTAQSPTDVQVSAWLTGAAGVVTNNFTLPVLRQVLGLAKAGLEWNSAGYPGGSYTLQVEVCDVQGLVLDDAFADFQIIHGAGVMSACSVNPQKFRYGEDVQLSAGFANVGSTPLDGTVVLTVQDGAGTAIAEFRHPFSALGAGDTCHAGVTWTNATLSPRNCRVLAYAEYAGQATPATLVAQWESEPLEWELTSVQQGTLAFQWYSVAGRLYTVEFTPTLTLPFAPVGDEVTAAPPINTFQHTPLTGSGFYRLRERR